MSKKRRGSKYYITQTPELIKARDKVRKYLYMRHVFPVMSTYIKIMGQKYNGETNALLNDRDREVLNEGIDNVTGLLADFKRELNNGMDKDK